MVHVVSLLAADVLELPAKDLCSRGITECDPAVPIQAVDALAGRVEDQLVLFLELRELAFLRHRSLNLSFLRIRPQFPVDHNFLWLSDYH